MILLAGVYFIWTVFILAATYQAYIRPYRSKIFFSYSHLDAGSARRVMEYLNRYRFRTWVDFGLAIPEETIEKQLKEAIGPAEVVVLLSSRHSAASRWVRFERSRALREKNKLRDFVVLALDEAGVKLYNSLARRLPPQIGKRLDKVPRDPDPSLRDRIGTRVFAYLARAAYGYAQDNRKFARIFDRQVVLFDLRRPFRDVMPEVVRHLQAVTKLKAGRLVSAWRMFMVGLWAGVTALLGALWLARF